jgi:hypothetical protein
MIIGRTLNTSLITCTEKFHKGGIQYVHYYLGLIPLAWTISNALSYREPTSSHIMKVSGTSGPQILNPSSLSDLTDISASQLSRSESA